MQGIRRPSLVEETVAHLRGQIRAGRWPLRLPGVCGLAAECGVSHPTMRAALLRLEQEGLLVPGGDGRPRTLARQVCGGHRDSLQVVVLLDIGMEHQDPRLQLVLRELCLELEARGHRCRIAAKPQARLNHDLARIKRYVATEQADAWVVVGGMAATLAWFAEGPLPVIALGGRCREVDIASTGRETLVGFREACRRLVTLGHARVVFIAAREMRHPAPSRHVEALMGELGHSGISAGSYHCPEWDETPEGLLDLLDRLFRLTPPSAILVQNTVWLAGVLAFLARRGLQVPHDVSVVCLCRDATFDWIHPSMCHLACDDRLMAKRVVRWVDAVVRGRPDRKCVPVLAEFMLGESIGPVADQEPVGTLPRGMAKGTGAKSRPRPFMEGA